MGKLEQNVLVLGSFDRLIDISVTRYYSVGRLLT